MEPAEAINALEFSFRELIRLVWGCEWIAKGKVDVTRLDQKLQEERAKRRGAVVSADLLDYTEFTQLGKILLDNWTDFADALGKRKYAEVYIDRLNGLRNAPMHGRVLLPFERDLLAGIVGEFRNLVAIYRSQRGPDMQHYPVIDSMVDSFGNVSIAGDISNEALVRLRVGDTMSFTCAGTDPQARTLLWRLEVMQGVATNETADQASGNAVTLTWVVKDTQVGETAYAMIVLRSDGQYHRRGDFDEQRTLNYAVDPPMERP